MKEGRREGREGRKERRKQRRNEGKKKETFYSDRKFRPNGCFFSWAFPMFGFYVRKEESLGTKWRNP